MSALERETKGTSSFDGEVPDAKLGTSTLQNADWARVGIFLIESWIDGGAGH